MATKALVGLKHGSRYASVTRAKASGATYTPTALANFVAEQILQGWVPPTGTSVRVLDPAVGEGALLISLLERIPRDILVEVVGFDSDPTACGRASDALRNVHPGATIRIEEGDFLASIVERLATPIDGLFAQDHSGGFDLVIANPPYVRTQILGAATAQELAIDFGLRGRVDLYYAFALGIAQVLRPHGVAGIITSNRFMTTKAGATLRRELRNRFNLRHVWDLGDTKLFDAAVLPAVLIAGGTHGASPDRARFSSIYETSEIAVETASSVIGALATSGVVGIPDGRSFNVQHGLLDFSSANAEEGVWRVATERSDEWLSTVAKHTWAPFSRIGKVRVGVKTCADKVFIGRDWDANLPDAQPELLRPLSTHHIARRFRPLSLEQSFKILYPHESVGGRKQAMDISKFPKSERFLLAHRSILEARTYVLEAGRQWYELWVAQDPAVWSKTKLVFRDISEEPCFWLDLDGTVVNGDCYWLACDDGVSEDLLWLAASIGNSTFVEAFYDHSFNNKLYAGRRRFITQYVEKFPLPDPHSQVARELVLIAKKIFEFAGAPEVNELQRTLDELVWSAFGLPPKERGR